MFADCDNSLVFSLNNTISYSNHSYQHILRHLNFVTYNVTSFLRPDPLKRVESAIWNHTFRMNCSSFVSHCCTYEVGGLRGTFNRDLQLQRAQLLSLSGLKMMKHKIITLTAKPAFSVVDISRHRRIK